MAAAVADFTPANPEKQKTKRGKENLIGKWIRLYQFPISSPPDISMSAYGAVLSTWLPKDSLQGVSLSPVSAAEILPIRREGAYSQDIPPAASKN